VGVALLFALAAAPAQAQTPPADPEPPAEPAPPTAPAAPSPEAPGTSASDHSAAPAAPDGAANEGAAPALSDASAPATERDNAPTTSAAEPAAASDVTVSGSPGKGLTVKAGDGFSMNVKARMQLRNTIARVDGETTNEINIRTVRLYTQGHVLTPELRYVVQFAFGPGEFDPSSPSPIFDAFVEYSAVRDLNVRAGQYFVPFDRARTIREFALQLVDRQQVIGELNLDRDTGVMLFSQDLFGLDGKLAYAAGVFGGSGRNRLGGDPMGFLYVARLGVRPFGAFDDDIEGDVERLPKPRLAIGIAGAYNHNTTRQRSTIGTPYETGTFDYVHAAADVVFKYAGFSFLGEGIYRRSPQEFRDDTVDGEAVREWTRSGWGYLAQAGMMLTDHLEVAARYDELFAIEETDPALVELAETQGREAGGGLNYYFNGHFFKLQTDYAARFGEGPTSHFWRLQLDATF
jgi:hypothetical protein